jgi:hypothetical protein
MKHISAHQVRVALGTLVVIAAAVVIVLNFPQGKKTTKQSLRTHPTPAATQSLTLPKPSASYSPKYPELNKRVEQFIQLYYARPVGQTPQQRRDAIAAAGLATPHFLQEMTLVSPPANQKLDAENIRIASELVRGSLGGELDEQDKSLAHEQYIVYSYQLTADNKPQYPTQTLASSDWKLVNNQWLVDASTS